MAHNNTTATIGQELHDNRLLSEYSIYALDASLNIVLGSIIAILGLIGNALSFAVYSHDRSSLVASFLFKSLSIIDSVVLIGNTLKNSMTYTIFGYLINDGAVRYALWECGSYTFQVSRAVSIWLTVVIAGVRYIAIRYPLQMRTKITSFRLKLVIAVLPFVVVLHFIPRMYVSTIHLCREFRRCHTNETVDAYYFTQREYEIFSTQRLMSEILITIIPLLLLIILSILLITAYHKSVKMARQMTGNNCEEQNQMTLSVIMVVVVLAICQLLSFAVAVRLYLRKHFPEGGIWHIIHTLRDFLYGLNSAVNFIIYSVCSKSFRVKLFSFVTKQPTRKSKRMPTTSTSCSTTC